MKDFTKREAHEGQLERGGMDGGGHSTGGSACEDGAEAGSRAGLRNVSLAQRRALAGERLKIRAERGR